MDANYALERARAIARGLLEGRTAPGLTGIELAEVFDALDKHMSKNGALPVQWRTQESCDSCVVPTNQGGVPHGTKESQRRHDASVRKE